MFGLAMALREVSFEKSTFLAFFCSVFTCTVPSNSSSTLQFSEAVNSQFFEHSLSIILFGLVLFILCLSKLYALLVKSIPIIF